ncbi:MAG: ParB N-terminal domain-containing protein [bacterium]|nr:ParB N-terminal domain-containing protein [bacterium]
MSKVKIKDIKIGKRIRKDYGNIKKLADDINKNGLIVPITINPDIVLISGERRIMAAKELGWTEIEAYIKTIRDYEHQINCEIAENEKRKDFTPSERVEYGRELEVIEQLKAKERQLSGEKIPLGSIETKVNKGKVDEVVGAKVGMSGTSYYRAKKVIDSGDKEVIEQMDNGKIGIITAYNKINKKEDKKVIQMPDKQETKEEGGSEKKSVAGTDSEKTFSPINIPHLQLSVNKFIKETNRYSLMGEYIHLLSKEQKKEISMELQLIEQWLVRFKKILLEV